LQRKVLPNSKRWSIAMKTHVGDVVIQRLDEWRKKQCTRMWRGSEIRTPPNISLVPFAPEYRENGAVTN
jgi:hypothetical protein